MTPDDYGSEAFPRIAPTFERPPRHRRAAPSLTAPRDGPR